MENLWKQMRVQLTGTEENKADLSAKRDQKTPIQKSQSFKEKKKGQNWFEKQLPRKTSRDYDSMEMEHAAAVAAVALTINLQEASEQKSETLGTLLAKTKSKVDNTKSPKSLLSSASKRLSGSFRSTDDHGDKVPISSVEEKKPEKAITRVPSMKKTSTFTDNKPDTPAPKFPPPPPPPPIRKTSRKPGQQTTTGSSIEERNAEEWERTELDKIRQRYEKLKEMIDSWENKKRMKSKLKLIKQEGELVRRRLKDLEKFQNKMNYVNQVAEGARAKGGKQKE